MILVVGVEALVMVVVVAILVVALVIVEVIVVVPADSTTGMSLITVPLLLT